LREVVGQLLAPGPRPCRRRPDEQTDELPHGEEHDRPHPGDGLRTALLGEVPGVLDRFTERLARRLTGLAAVGLDLGEVVPDDRAGDVAEAQLDDEVVAPLLVLLDERPVPDLLRGVAAGGPHDVLPAWWGAGVPGGTEDGVPPERWVPTIEVKACHWAVPSASSARPVSVIAKYLRPGPPSPARHSATTRPFFSSLLSSG